MLFIPRESRGRQRRPVDGLLVVLAAFIVAGASVTASLRGIHERPVVDAARVLLDWFDSGWRFLYAATLIAAGAVVLGSVLFARWRLIRDLVITVGATYGLGLVIGRATTEQWPRLDQGLWQVSDQYPAIRLAVAIAVLVVAAPDLTRSARLVSFWLSLVGSLAAIVLGIGLPSGVLGGFGLGLGVAGLVRLVMGTAEGFPGLQRTRADLASLGVPVQELRVSTRQRAGTAIFAGTDDAGRPIQALVLGRDAQDTQRLASLWRNLAYRQSGPDLAPGRVQQIEHESLLTLLAGRAGVRVPDVRLAGIADSGDAVLLFEQAELSAAATDNALLTPAFLHDLWHQADLLRTARISHGGLNLGNVLVGDDGPVVVEFNRSQLSASPAALDVDLAELLVSTTIAVGADRSLAAALDTVGQPAIAGALPFLQRAALTPHLRDVARERKLDFEKLRSQAAAVAGVTAPAMAPVRRVRPRNLLIMAFVGVAAYLIISQLAEVGFGTIYDQLKMAYWPWLVAALVFAQLTFVSQAVSLRGAVVTAIPLPPCVVLQAAIKFINLTVPTSAGRIAINIRFLQRLGVNTGEAVAAGTVDDVASTLIQIVLVVALIPVVDSKIHLKLPSAGDARSFAWIALLLVALVGLVVLAVLAVPRWRHAIVPTVRQSWTALRTVGATRSKRWQLFGGNIATQLLFALVLGTVCRSYGVQLSLATLLFVNMAATVFSNLIPVPGGIGVAEAGLTTGLVAVGVPQSTAFAIALTHRICTYYLPPVWGYFSLRWLTRKGYV